MLDRGTLLRVTGIVAIVTGAVACGASNDAQSAVPLATATPDEPPQKEEPATLDIYANPPTDVLVDGKPAGKTPIKAFKVEAGSHDVTFMDETGRRTMTVKVEPGEGKSVISDRPPTMTDKPADKKPADKKK